MERTQPRIQAAPDGVRRVADGDRTAALAAREIEPMSEQRDDSEDARRRRAKRIRGRIEEIANPDEKEEDAESDRPRRSPPTSPHKFIQDRMREEREKE